jgi:hypothetical protein
VWSYGDSNSGPLACHAITAWGLGESGYSQAGRSTCVNPAWKSLDDDWCACTVATRIVPRRLHDQHVFDARTSRAEIRLALAAGQGPGESTAVRRPGPAGCNTSLPHAGHSAPSHGHRVRMGCWCEPALSWLYLVGWLAGRHQDQAHLSAFQVVSDPAKTGCQNLTSAS